MEKDDSKNQADIAWETRILCSDGNCIGVIGEDGRCKECGIAYDGELPVPTARAATPDAPADPEPLVDATPAGDEVPEDESDDDWDNRTLCSDGNCIGVIGPAGRCKECGKPPE